MKIFLASIFVICSLFCAAQNINVETIKEGDVVIVKVTNDDDIDYKLEFVLKTIGYSLQEEHKFDVEIPRSSVKEVGRYQAEKGVKNHSFKLEYKASLQKSNTENQPIVEDDSELAESKIVEDKDVQADDVVIVYSNKDCGRCEMTVKYLTTHKIPFKELNTVVPENNNKMADAIFNNGFEGGSLLMPVIVVGDEVHYDIKNLSKFLNSLK